jgi:hypothetical protein
VAESHVSWQQVAGLKIEDPLLNLVAALWAPDNQPPVRSIPERVNRFRAIVICGSHEQRKNMVTLAQQAPPALGRSASLYSTASLQACYVLSFGRARGISCAIRIFVRDAAAIRELSLSQCRCDKRVSGH